MAAGQNLHRAELSTEAEQDRRLWTVESIEEGVALYELPLRGAGAGLALVDTLAADERIAGGPAGPRVTAASHGIAFARDDRVA